MGTRLCFAVYGARVTHRVAARANAHAHAFNARRPGTMCGRTRRVRRWTALFLLCAILCERTGDSQRVRAAAVRPSDDYLLRTRAL